MDGDRLDQLSRVLGRGVHRRAAVAALAALAVGGAEEVTAKHKHKRQGRAAGGNSACAKFCAAVFGADTPAAGQCTSEAARGNPKALCANTACATNGAPDATKVCCVKQNGVCPTYAAATCCTGTDTCQGGTCGPACTACCAPPWGPPIV